MRRATVPPSGQNAGEAVLIEEELKSVLTIPSMSFCFSPSFSFKDWLFFFYPAKIQKFMEEMDRSS